MPKNCRALSALLMHAPLAALVTAALPIEAAEPTQVQDVESMSVVFTPGASGYNAITRLIDGAARTIRVGAYHFRSPTITDALIRARQRGADVALIMDAKNLKSPANEGPRAAEAGIRVYVDTAHKIHHNKYIVVDGLWVETGSFNFHDPAEYRYAENLIIVKSAMLAREYEANWEAHRAHAQPLESIHTYALSAVH
ncbi:MAG: phospholipase D-like domain-containing protein [Sutterella sp.]